MSEQRRKDHTNVLKYINTYWMENYSCPSTWEIIGGTDLKSLSGLTDILRDLENQGELAKEDTPRIIPTWIKQAIEDATMRRTLPSPGSFWNIPVKTAVLAALTAERDALAEIGRKMLDYRDRNGAINFQLEKFDDYLDAMRAALAKVTK